MYELKLVLIHAGRWLPLMTAHKSFKTCLLVFTTSNQLQFSPIFFVRGSRLFISIVIFLLAFYEYKKKTCSLFARSFNIMLLTFDQVCRTGIEILTKCEQRNIAHMYVISHIQKHAILQLVFCSLFTNTKRKAVLSSPAHSTWCC